MKSYFIFEMPIYSVNGKTLEKKNALHAVLVSSLPALCRLETETGVKFTPTGLNADAFGRSYISQHIREDRIFTFSEAKKHLLWYARINK